MFILECTQYLTESLIVVVSVFVIVHQATIDYILL